MILWKLKRFWRELMAASDEAHGRRMREAIAADAARHGGVVTWDPVPDPVPELRADVESPWDRVVYRGEPVTRAVAERRFFWDNLMGLRAEARKLMTEVDDEGKQMLDFHRISQLLEE